LKKKSRIFYLAIGLFVVLAASIGGIAYSFSFDKGKSKEENPLLEGYNGYISENDMKSLEIHEEDSYIYSLYLNGGENTLGIMEYSKDSKKTSEVNSHENLSFAFLDGKYNNYIGIQFNKFPDSVGYFEVVFDDDKQERFDVNTPKDKEYTDSYMAKVDYDFKEIKAVKVYDNDGNELYSKQIKDVN
jgi:hypothetical protein